MQSIQGIKLFFLLKVYPNPSNGNFIVHYQLPVKEGRYKLELSSVEGKILEKLELTEQQGMVRINCNNCNTGNYILSLYIDDDLYKSTEITVKK